MQEAWGSSPHSSTVQKNNSKKRASRTAAKYSSREPHLAPRDGLGQFLVPGWPLLAPAIKAGY